MGTPWCYELDFLFFGLTGDISKMLTFCNMYPDMFMLVAKVCDEFVPSWALGLAIL